MADRHARRTHRYRIADMRVKHLVMRAIKVHHAGMENEPVTNVRLPTRMWEAVRRLAEADRRSATAELAVLLREALATRQEKP